MSLHRRRRQTMKLIENPHGHSNTRYTRKKPSRWLSSSLEHTVKVRLLWRCCLGGLTHLHRLMFNDTPPTPRSRRRHTLRLERELDDDDRQCLHIPVSKLSIQPQSHIWRELTGKSGFRSLYAKTNSSDLPRRAWSVREFAAG